MEININLSSQPFIDLRPIMRFLRRIIAGLAVLIVVLSVAVYFMRQKAEAARLHVQSLETEIARVTAEQQRYRAMMQLPESVAVLRKTTELNQLVDAKAFSWTLAMEDLETVLPSGVQVTAIEPVLAKGGRVTLHMRVHGPRDKSIELLRNIELSRCFRSPRIAGESADTSNQGSQSGAANVPDGTELDLFAEYDPDFSDRPNVPASSTISTVGATPKQSEDKPHPSKKRNLPSHFAAQRLHVTPEAGGAE